MTAIRNALAFVDDRLNPIVVRELRQAVQSRFVIVVLMLYLTVEFFAMWMMLMFNGMSMDNFTAGRDVFLMLNGILLGTCLLFVPAYVGVRLAAERSQQNVDLVFITTIRPRSIIWGKAGAALALTILIYSACSPFMVMTYLLRGVDIPSIAVVLSLDLLVIAGGVFLAMFIGALPTHWLSKALLGLLLMMGMASAFTMSMAAANACLYMGIGSRLNTWDFWGPALLFCSLVIAADGLLLYLAGVMLMPPAANRARAARIYVTLAWLIIGTLVWTLPLVSPVPIPFFKTAWIICIMPILGLAIMVGVSERDQWGPRLANAIPRRVWLRPLWLVFSSGALGGVIWACLLIAITLGVYAWEIKSPTSNYPKQVLIGEITFACFVLAYSLTAVLLRDYIFRRKIKTPVVGSLALLMMAGGTIIPVLTVFFMSPDMWDRDASQWMFLNPLSGLIEARTGDQTYYLTIAAVWCAAAVLLNIPWMIRQVAACRPPAAARTAAPAVEPPLPGTPGTPGAPEPGVTVAATQGGADG